MEETLTRFLSDLNGRLTGPLTMRLFLQPSVAGGHIRTIRAEVDKLLETSFFLSQELYDQLLRLADEHGS